MPTAMQLVVDTCCHIVRYELKGLIPGVDHAAQAGFFNTTQQLADQGGGGQRKGSLQIAAVEQGRAVRL